MTLNIEYKLPSPNEWKHLRSFSDWKIFSDDVFQRAAKHSLFGICIYDNDRIVGMGRVVGDGIICFYIQDVIVDVEYRNKCIGTLIMKHLLKFIFMHAEPGATIALFSHIGTEKFYEHFGFLIREMNGKGSGMFLPYSNLQENTYE